MSAHGPRRERPEASIEELIVSVRQESAAALSTAEAFLPDADAGPALAVPRRFPGPDAQPGHPDRSPRDPDTDSRPSGGPA